MKQYFTVVGLSDEHEQVKYAVGFLEGKALTWWRGQCATLDDPFAFEFGDFEEVLTTEFTDVDWELKMRRKL